MVEVFSFGLAEEASAEAGAVAALASSSRSPTGCRLRPTERRLGSLSDAAGAHALCAAVCDDDAVATAPTRPVSSFLQCVSTTLFGGMQLLGL